LLTETADVLDRIDQRVWRGRLWLSAGSILRRSGRRTLARTHLSSALEDFRQIGALAWVERVNDELRACGVKVGSARSEPLTGAELRVAAAVAGGLTNREVASTLFLSTKTVEFHLAHVYRKLGVRNRSGLARAMHSRAASVG
jgi:DNA-binding CsgD family transcriptional regulator